MITLPPAVMARSMQTPRAVDFIRRGAFGQIPFPDFLRGPPRFLAMEWLREGAFTGDLSPEQEDVLWHLTTDLLALYATDKFTQVQGLQLGLAWKGVTGVLGWGSIAPKLPPEVRGPLAYVGGNRLLRLEKPKEAEALFLTALRDSAPDSPLHRLAQADLDRLHKK
jgi:hypothetical protein